MVTMVMVLNIMGTLPHLTWAKLQAEGQWQGGEMDSSDGETASELEEEAQIIRLIQKRIGRK